MPNPFQEIYDIFKKRDVDPNNPRNKEAWNIDKLLMHAHSEISELWDAVRKDKPREKKIEEVADVMNLAIIIAVRFEVEPDELLEACKHKLADRRRRDSEGFKV